MKIPFVKSFRGHKPPNSIIVLGRILDLFQNNKLTKHQAVEATVQELIEFWEPLHKNAVREKRSIVKKVRKFFNEYGRLSKQPKQRLKDSTYQKKS